MLGTLFAVAVCLLTRTASAMPAPFCDDRGATLLASPPPLEATDLAALRTIARPKCSGDRIGSEPVVAPDQGQQESPSSQEEPVLPAFHVPVVSPAGEPLARPPVVTPSTEGVHLRVERPPRA